MPAADPPRKLDPQIIERARRLLRRRDPVLGAVITRHGRCELKVRGRPYDALLSSVLHQQLAGPAARAIESRFKSAHGGRFPRPADLVDCSDEALRSLGLSRRKAETVRRVAEAFASGQLSSQRLHRGSDDAVIEALTGLKGIGVWTAHMIMMTSLGRPDVLPVGDYGIRKGARAIYGLDDLPGPAELESIAESWRPYRSVASWYLWRAADEAGRMKIRDSDSGQAPRVGTPD
jgi:DNA-3-methyladenine glycosylase II